MAWPFSQLRFGRKYRHCRSTRATLTAAKYQLTGNTKSTAILCELSGTLNRETIEPTGTFDEGQ